MIYSWLKDCYHENQFQLWMLNCLTEKQFINLVTKKQEQQSDIKLQEKIINQIIAKNCRYSYCYAYFILYGPFPAGEPAIATSAIYAFRYSLDILKKPFPAGEPAIMTEKGFWNFYNLHFFKKPNRLLP